MKEFKYGRKQRSHNPNVPHLRARLKDQVLPPIPDSIDYTAKMPADLGMMLNDRLGDCTCAAYYHARQVWTCVAQGTEITEPDHNVQKLYEEACGYIPFLPWTDRGGIEQDVLTFLLNTGAPIGPHGQNRQKILGFVEVDNTNIDHVKRTIFESGVAYIGFPIPSNFSQDSEVWDYDPRATITDQGHAVVLAGYDSEGAVVISWGKRYKMTWSFVVNVVDEIYLLVDQSWIEATGLTPAGITLTELEQQMQYLRK